MTTLAVKAPCGKCPFRRDVPIYLTLERRREIVQDCIVDGHEFWCHQSVNYDDDVEDDALTGTQVCAGIAKMTIAAGGAGSQLLRIAETLQGHEFDETLGAAVWTVKEFTNLPMGAVDDGGGVFLGFVTPEFDEVEPCEVCGPGCLAPAGYLGVNGAIVTGTESADAECSDCGIPVCSECISEDGLCDSCQNYVDTEEEEFA